METIKVAIADDHAIVRDGIKQLLETEEYIKIIGEAANGIEAIRLVETQQPDILIMDISMPKMTGIDATKKLQEKQVATKILILSMFDKEEYVLKAVELGAFGYLLKDTSKDKFIKAIHTIHEGSKYFSSEISNVIINQYLSTVQNVAIKKEKELLTRREKEILALIIKGYNNKKIAESLDISVRTIETHRLNIMKKLHVNNAAELVRITLEKDLVSLK